MNSTSSSSGNEPSNYLSISEARETREASTVSQQKDSTSQIENDAMVAEKSVPETCSSSSNNSSIGGGSSSSGCSGTSSKNAEGNSSTGNDNSTITVST